MKNKLVLLSLLVFAILTLSYCKKCKEQNTENADVPANQKNGIFHFSDGTRWVFKSNVGEMDTVLLGPLLYYYDGGHCKDNDCCTKVFNQKLKQNLNYVSDPTDTLQKFISFNYYLEHDVDRYGGGSMEFSTFQNFNSQYQTTLVVNGTTLNDVEFSTHPSLHLGDPGTDKAYWSLTKGLVRYDYQKLDGTYIIYERQDL